MEIVDVKIDEERAEAVYQAMLEEAIEKNVFYGITRLQFAIELREAVWEGARRYEEKKAKAGIGPAP